MNVCVHLKLNIVTICIFHNHQLEDVPFDFDEDSNEECSNCSDDEKDTPSEEKYYIPLSTVSW